MSNFRFQSHKQLLTDTYYIICDEFVRRTDTHNDLRMIFIADKREVIFLQTKTDMVHKLRFSNYDPQISDFDSKNGEATMATNLYQNTDGSYGPGLNACLAVSIPEKLTAVAIHEVGQQKNLILKQAIGDGQSRLLWTRLEEETLSSAMKEIATVADIRCVEMAGSIVALATSRGLRYIVWYDSDYTCVDLTEAFPELEFGLVKAGTLTCTETFTISEESTQEIITGAAGSGANRPHPSAETEREDCSALYKGIAKAYTDAVAEQVVAKGYFHLPFFIRYALRTADGSHILPSAPLLMLPTVLPPCLGVSTTSSSGRYTVTTDFSAVKYFKLCYRTVHLPDPAVSKLVSAIDIFISPSIATFDKARLDDGYITSYSKVVGARNIVGIRGTRGLNRAENEIFEGHYSESGEDFADHYLSTSVPNRKALMVHPNLEFNRQICTMADFQRIATVPLAETEGFTQLEILTSEITTPNISEQLNEQPLSLCRLDVSSMLMHENTLVAAMDRMQLPTPYPLITTERNDTILKTITIDVHLRIDGNTMCATRSIRSAESVGSLISRYMFYPDPRAYLMAISDGDITYLLPLTAHEKLCGAYWHGGTGTDFLPEPATDYVRDTTNGTDTATDRRSRLLVSAKDSPMVFDLANASSFTQSAITALCPATKAPRSGVFGRHNLYAFTADGLWMLEYSGGKIKSSQKISTNGCRGREAMADTGDAIYFESRGKIFSAEGSAITAVTDALESWHPSLLNLPYANQLLEAAEMTSETITTEMYFGRCGLLYAAEPDALVAYNPEEDYSLVYNIGQKSWMISDMAISGKIKSKEGELAIDKPQQDMTGIVKIRRTDDPIDTFVVTRPIKLDSMFGGGIIRSIEILGQFGRGKVRFAAYGTQDMRHWHLMASSESRHAEGLSNSRYRMMKICVCARLEDDEYLYGMLINADD